MTSPPPGSTTRTSLMARKPKRAPATFSSNVGGLGRVSVRQGVMPVFKSRTALAAACAATLAFAPTAFADGDHGGGQVTPRDQGAKRYVAGVSVPEIVKHQVALQRIATLNDDTREVFSPGYRESVDYVVQTL